MNKKTFGHIHKNLVRVSLWVPCWTNYQTYQGNPCGVYPDLSSFTGSGVYPDLSSFTGSGVYPDLSSFTGSGVIQISVACIKRSVPSQDQIIWYKGFDSWSRFYPILFFFFVICPGSCFVLILLFVFLFASCCILVYVFVSFLFLFLVSFTLCVKKNCKKIWKKKVGVWSLNTKLRHLEVFFLKENRGTNPLI